MVPQGSKSAYTPKQRRQARHIEDSVKGRGGSPATAARIAYATINKQDGGGKKSGSGRSNHPRKTTSRMSGLSSRPSRKASTKRTSRWH